VLRQFLFALLLVATALAAEPKLTVAQPVPTLANVPYGDHHRQVLDFYRAASATPTPVLLYLHGGAWMNGEKTSISRRDFPRLLASGISIVSINYRYVYQAKEAHIKPPVAWPMADAARALQFVRSKAAEWNLDPLRVAGSGNSAGACSILWLALHDDLADRASADPVARESTRLLCAALDAAQTSLDPVQMREWTQYSPIEQATPDDPPVYLSYDNKPALGQPQKDPTHSANFGVKLKERLDALGVPCELAYPGAPAHEHDNIESYLIAKLGAAPGPAQAGTAR
jgi:acetyl esterase/lipase